MRTMTWVLLVAALGSSGWTNSTAAEAKIRVLIVTGGHAFETNQFFAMFADNAEITWQHATHPDAHRWLRPSAAAEYDVLVSYDMWPDISAEAKADFVARLREGKGFVALHHCLASYSKWDEYRKIVGGKYHLEPRVENGVEKPGSTYLHDVKVSVHVAAVDHPVTRGLKDFVVQDETYGNFEVLPGVDVLLTTDAPTSTPTIAWAHEYDNARVVYIQLGHDHLAFENPNYRRLVAQAIRWAARRS